MPSISSRHHLQYETKIKRNYSKIKNKNSIKREDQRNTCIPFNYSSSEKRQIFKNKQQTNLQITSKL